MSGARLQAGCRRGLGISGLVAVLALLGCGSAAPRPAGALEVMRRNPDAICRITKAENRAPSDLENELYLSRFDVASGLVEWPIDIACISSQYSLRRAKSWAKNGDPVAQYIVLYKTYKTDVAVCRNLEKIVKELNRISNYKMINTKVNKLVNRVPEASYLAVDVAARCGVGGRSGIVGESVIHGFNPGPMISKIE